jgi:hypothetical protein
MKIVIGPYRKNRKISVRIDKYDTWSMDDTLALIILPMLKQLKKTEHGAPFTDDADVPERLSSKHDKKFDPKKGETDKNFFKRWDWILGEMIWAFEQKNKDWETQFYSGKVDHLWQAFDKEGNKIGKPEKIQSRSKANAEYYQLVHGPKHTFKVDRKGLKKHHDRMLNGFRLFGKYYENLWD